MRSSRALKQAPASAQGIPGTQSMVGAQSPADTAHSSRGSSDGEQASSAASSISQPAARRGGYMDSGGFTKSGELPAADPVYMTSDRETKQELDSILKKLSPTAEWTVRIQALLRLEGVVLGGAPSSHGFLELFRPLQDPLITQLLDRRSAVSRQACQLICVLSQAMGSQFDSLAVQLLPALFKVLVITVQVMADAAHECIRAIVTNSHSWRIVQRISDAVCKDRSPKLRLCCAEYLAQVILDWDAIEYERSTDALESAIKAAVQDALSETRNAGRAAFGAYSRARPDRVSAVLGSVDSSLRQKLKEALQEGQPAVDRAALLPIKPPAPRQSAIPTVHVARDAAGPAKRISGKPPPRGRFSIAAPAEAAALAQQQPQAQPPARASMKPRKSLSGAALRINMPVDATGSYGDRSQVVYPTQSASAMQQPASMDLHLSGSEYVSSCTHSEDSAAAVPFAQLLANAAAGGSDWKIRVDGFESLTAALCSPSGAHGVAANLDRLVALFVENIGESHAKVAAACLHALAAAFSMAGSQLERHLDRLTPPLLLRAVDGKEPIRRAASQALTILPGSVSADAYLAALTGAVGSKKSIKAQIAAMESFIAAAEQHLLPGPQIIPHILREWVERLAGLAVDKHLEVRRTAEQALARVHSLVDSSALREHLDAVDLASDIRTTLLQILQVASAAEAPEAPPAGEQSLEAQHAWPAGVSQNGADTPDPAELDLDRQLRLSEDPAGAEQPDASLPVVGAAGQVRSGLGQSAQQQPLRAQPTLLLPVEESADSENGQTADQTPSSMRLPSPHLQREALSPLLNASNFRNQPPASQGHASPKLESPLSMRTPGSKVFSLSQFATPPTALPVRRSFGSMADAQAHVEMLMEGVAGHLPLLCLQALPAALAATPSAVWEPMLPESMLPALERHALRGDLEVRKAALLALEAVGCHAVLLEMGHFEGTVLGLLTCCCDTSREVCMLARQALEAIAGKLPRQQAFQKFVDALCKEQQQDGTGEAPLIQVMLRCCGVLVRSMGRAEADAALQGDLTPALVKAFQHSSADVRKAVVFLLVDAWKKVGQDLIPYLKDLNTSQQKLVAIYIDRASQQQV